MRCQQTGQLWAGRAAPSNFNCMRRFLIDLGQLRPSRRAVPDGVCPTQQRPRTSGSQPGSVSSPTSARWPMYSSSGSASWALDVDIGAGVFQQTDPLHVDIW